MARLRGEGVEGEPQSGQAAVEVRRELVPRLAEGEFGERQCVFAVAETLQGPGDAGEAVVEADGCSRRRFLAPQEQPFLCRGAAVRPARVQCVQHAGRSVTESQTPARGTELGDVTREDTVLPLR